MDAQLDPYAYIGQLEQIVHDQMANINQLRSEVDRLVSWINGDTDALHCLQSVYNDASTSEANRIKAASAALPFERAKLSVSVQVTGPGVLGARLDQTAKPPMKTVSPPLIEHVPAGD
jgi:hypothetical protein